MTKSVQFENANADFYVPDGMEAVSATHRTTHLGIGAHQDDLEFMAMHGILECYQDEHKWFSGVTCTNGSGSSRTGPYADTTDEEMQEIRAEEQREASRVGKYGFMAQLGYSSEELKFTCKERFVADLVTLIQIASPKVIYTHNLADKHATHIAVALAVIKAVRSLPEESRPEALIGCEGWRDLDWLPDEKKVVMDLCADLDLATRLNGIFKSQISGGKRYDIAVKGRRQASATFLDSHSVDASTSVCFGMDLTPLINDEQLSPKDYTFSLIKEFQSDVEKNLKELG